MSPFATRTRGVAAALLAVMLGTGAHAAAPRRAHPPRRGDTFRTPPKPVIIDSSPTIETLNTALKALGATGREYGGHRVKAVGHVAAAIHHLETPAGRGKSNAAIQKAAAGQPAAATKTAATPQAAADESLRKARTALFAAHHQLADHTASLGHIRADAEVRVAINEVVEALKPAAATPAAGAGATAAAAR